MNGVDRLGWAKELIEMKGLASLERGRMEVQEQVLDDGIKVLESIKDFGGQGWICFTDRVDIVDASGQIGDGNVLSAELCKGDVSLHVRYIGDKWHVYKIQEGQGTEHLVLDEERLRIGGGSLHYRVAWGFNNDRTELQPVMFRFTGFGRA
ncbi:MAG: hypothetical protein GXP49_06265 [Deltaproteobacteria bacterium]|nr:hypothetical protein [Deltaproteobacteria bacterium]